MRALYHGLWMLQYHSLYILSRQQVVALRHFSIFVYSLNEA
jgi:hypothetical protein